LKKIDEVQQPDNLIIDKIDDAVQDKIDTRQKQIGKIQLDAIVEDNKKNKKHRKPRKKKEPKKTNNEK